MNVLFQLLRSFSYRDKKVFLKLYITYVRPHLEFASPVWNPWLRKDIKLLERVQLKFVRNVQGLRTTEYRDRLNELGILSLENRRLYLDLVETFKGAQGYIYCKILVKGGGEISSLGNWEEGEKKMRLRRSKIQKFSYSVEEDTPSTRTPSPTTDFVLILIPMLFLY